MLCSLALEFTLIWVSITDHRVVPMEGKQIVEYKLQLRVLHNDPIYCWKRFSTIRYEDAVFGRAITLTTSSGRVYLLRVFAVSLEIIATGWYWMREAR